MATIVAITNQKGGVGKTTTALNLGAGLMIMGSRVLFIDMDPQCSLTYSMRGDTSAATIQEVMLRQTDVAAAIQKTDEGDLVAASPNLGAMDSMLNQTGKEFRLRETIAPILQNYDYIVIDSPPTLGILTINIMTVATTIIIPAIADIFSLHGVGQLYSSIQAVKTYCNPNLGILGILLTRHTDRYILSREMREMLTETASQLGTQVFTQSIREAVALREAQASQQSIFTYAPKSKQAMDYEGFVLEFLQCMESCKE